MNRTDNTQSISRALHSLAMPIDEAQNIKNADTAQSKAVRSIPAKLHGRICQSHTAKGHRYTLEPGTKRHGPGYNQQLFAVQRNLICYCCL